MLVPENIFDIAPEIEILNYDGLGAQFLAFQDKNQFSISVTFEISNDAYYNDEPLIINDKKFDLNNIGDILLDGYGKTGKLSDLVVLDIQSSVSQETLDTAEKDIMDKLELAENGINDPSTLPQCDPITQEELDELSDAGTTTFDIKNADAEVIETVTMDLTDDSKICKNASGLEEQLKASFLNSLPPIEPGNNITPTSTPLCSLPEGELKGKVQEEIQKLNLGESSVEDYNKKLLDDGIMKQVQKQLDIISDDTGVDLNTVNPETVNAKTQEVIKNSLPTYGIPLIQINLDLNIIIQIIDGKLNVLNFDKYILGQTADILEENAGLSTDPNLKNILPDITKKKLEIDITDPEAKILPEVIYTMVYTRKFNYHSVELKKFYGDKVFQDEETSSINTGLYYLGMDKSGLKQFCGKIYDVHLQKDPIDINNVTFGQNLFPDLYGALAFYDFFNKDDDNTRIKYNRVYPYKSLGKPLSLRGREWYLETRKAGNYTFPNHSIIDDMFCKNKFTNESFTVILFLKRNAFMSTTGSQKFNIVRQVLLSDPINNNTVYYDEKNLNLHVEFHGYSSEIFINFVPNQWYQLTLRYNYEEQNFKTDIHYKNLKTSEEFAFLSSSSTRTLNNTMPLDKDIDEAISKRFMLNSLYAEYSFSKKEYINPFDTLCGPIVLYDKYVADEIISGIFESFYPVLYYYRDVGSIYSEKGILYNY